MFALGSAKLTVRVSLTLTFSCSCLLVDPMMPVQLPVPQ